MTAPIIVRNLKTKKELLYRSNLPVSPVTAEDLLPDIHSISAAVSNLQITGLHLLQIEVGLANPLILADLSVLAAPLGLVDESSYQIVYKSIVADGTADVVITMGEDVTTTQPSTMYIHSINGDTNHQTIEAYNSTRSYYHVLRVLVTNYMEGYRGFTFVGGSDDGQLFSYTTTIEKSNTHRIDTMLRFISATKVRDELKTQSAAQCMAAIQNSLKGNYQGLSLYYSYGNEPNRTMYKIANFDESGWIAHALADEQ